MKEEQKENNLKTLNLTKSKIKDYIEEFQLNVGNTKCQSDK